MIDTVKFYAYMPEQLLRRLENEDALKQAGIAIYNNVFYLKHPFGLKNLAVYFNSTESQFHLETSLPKLFQGHNVFGSNRLEYLIFQTIEFIYKRLGLLFTAEERCQIAEHRIRLGRIDATCSFRLASQEQVADVLEAIWDQLRAEGFKWSAYGWAKFESVYNQQHSTRVSDKFYNKCREVLSRMIPESVVARDLILDYVMRLLRFEVTWRGKELKRLDCEYADQWSPSLVREMLIGRLEKLKLRGAISSYVKMGHLDRLNNSCSTYYGLWAAGANLRRFRANRTLHRAREQILAEHQVDIYRSYGVGSGIPLNKLLHAKRAIFSAPKSLTSRGAIFFGRRNTQIELPD